MASATSSRRLKGPEPLCAVEARLRGGHARLPVPLLVLRLPDFERVAWQRGKRAARQLEARVCGLFVRSAAPVLRDGDMLAHDRGTDTFCILLAAPARSARAPAATDCRSVLERVAAAMSIGTQLHIETGWGLVHDAGLDDFAANIARALDHGARERERYAFFAAVGHELRTPLTSIRGYLETLIESDLDAQTQERFLCIAWREALRMGRLLETMFEFSLLDLSSHSASTGSCDLAEQVQLAADVVAPAARSAGIDLEFDAPWQIDVCLEPDACLQLIVNLLDNAIKYGTRGGWVRVSARKGTDEAVLVVEDDGPGIVHSEREAIFSLRVRGSHAVERPGMGIGLAIVKLIADRAGGSVVCAESDAGGARFEVRLPLRAELGAAAS